MTFIYQYTTKDNVDEDNQVKDESLVKFKETKPTKSEVLLSTWDKDDWVKVQKRNKAEKILALLNAKADTEVLTLEKVATKLEAVINQINLLHEALATGDNSKIVDVHTKIQGILNE